MSANNQLTLDQKFNILENKTISSLIELKYRILNEISDAVYDLQPDDHSRYLLDLDRQDRIYQRGISLQIKDWDGLSVSTLPVIDPYEESINQYKTGNLEQTVPENYRGDISTGPYPDPANPYNNFSADGHISSKLNILAIDTAGQALVSHYHDSTYPNGGEEHVIEVMPSEKAFALADSYRSINENLLAMSKFGIHLNNEVDIFFADPQAVEDHKAIPGESYIGEILGVSSAGYALQILDNKEMVIHETQRLTTDISQMRGQNVVIDYSHGAVGIVREHAELQQASALELHRESQLEMGE